MAMKILILCQRFSFKAAMLAIGFLVVSSPPAHPASIVQSLSFLLQEHASSFGFYNGFDPSLGTLTEVDLHGSGGARSDNFTFTTIGTSQPVTYTGTIRMIFVAATS